MNFNEIFEDFQRGQGNLDRLYRNRPYKGQPHTDNGERGKQLVAGLTMRDLGDCFIFAAFQAGNDQLTPERYEEVKAGKVCRNDLYKLDWNKLDPGALMQNMTCNVERMMGIYPNVPELVAAPMQKNFPGEKCPRCGAEEIEAATPATVYACGSQDYDQRPGTFKAGDKCTLKDSHDPA